jgi:hypothetical protein
LRDEHTTLAQVPTHVNPGVRAGQSAEIGPWAKWADPNSLRLVHSCAPLERVKGLTSWVVTPHTLNNLTHCPPHLARAWLWCSIPKTWWAQPKSDLPAPQLSPPGGASRGGWLCVSVGKYDWCHTTSTHPSPSRFSFGRTREGSRGPISLASTVGGGRGKMAIMRDITK